MGLAVTQRLDHREVQLSSFTRRVIKFQINWGTGWLVRFQGNIKFFLSSALMLSLTIYLRLLKGSIEKNPGPTHDTKIGQKSNVSFITYNANGLGDRNKLKRLLSKLNPLVEKGSIIFLQETHIVNTDYLKSIWKNSFRSNCVKTNSAGVIILFSSKYNVTFECNDEGGRQLIVVIENDDQKFILTNVYFPNDHKQSVRFAEEVYLKILEVQNKYPEHLTCLAGDFNLCVSKADSINRKRTSNEQLLADVIISNNKVTRLTDAYRQMNKEDGYTWNRGTCYSRLDYIFVSNEIGNKITKAKTNWAFEMSDHAAVEIVVALEQKVNKGPGITKLNIKILEDPKIAAQIGMEIEEMMTQTSETWNPHMKLEFLKVAIRTVISAKVSELRKAFKTDINETEEETNQIQLLKIRTLKLSEITEEERKQRLETIETTLTNLKDTISKHRQKLSETVNFVTKAKWFEYGEKSNKFFLNLTKVKQRQTLISKIINNDKLYEGQEKVTEGITAFYKDLYKKEENVPKDDSSFYENCPKMTNEQTKFLDEELSLEDLRGALNTCKDSSPGPDGIPYSIYKTYWKTCGPILLNAWRHSIESGKLTISHSESIITLLPKEGKDTTDIKNWRPITLSNCDSKIITKAISTKVSKVLESIIDPSQTAYVPGRAVSDNLRTNFFYKNYCKKNDVNAVLISLDAKKARDSVSHEYIEETLIAYGFGPAFVKSFKVLYNDIKARIMINGFMSEAINIERGVKQGDALSCAIFIICIDPLLRNLNKNKEIKRIPIMNKGKICKNIIFKAAAYADDISIICEKSLKSIQNVFSEYERLTRRSGLELNADKTEILILNKKEAEIFNINYKKKECIIKSVPSIKICGLYYCYEKNDEYNLNVLEKIKKLNYKMKLWSTRYLTMEGKALIIKTFGLSQIIYNMQSYNFNLNELKMTEKLIFQFLWSTKDNPEGRDRIKRSIMKNDYSKGGMKITDLECLDRSLKLKQTIRANFSSHIISKIQTMNNLEMNNNLMQEQNILEDDEVVCKIAKETLNIITDYNRKQYEKLESEEFESDKNLIEEVASINLKTYLERKKLTLHLCMLKRLNKIGINTLGELIQQYEHENNRDRIITIRFVMSAFPKHLLEITKCFNDDVNQYTERINYMTISPNVRKDIRIVTVKELQITLKNVLGKIECLNVNNKVRVKSYKEEYITHFRQSCKNSKLRNIYFRLIHNDFFTKVKLKKYKMIESDRCTRCDLQETTEHLLWECNETRNIWKIFNEIMNKLEMNQDKIKEYEDVYKPGSNSAIALIKIKIIQELIQIERPRLWNKENVTKIILEMIKIEKYNSETNKTNEKYGKKWSNIIRKLNEL
jgi:exonuclease III